MTTADYLLVSDWSSDVCASDLSDDIIVTAEHRSSSVQDTPIAVSAFEAQKLSNQGIVSVEGLSQVAPSLQIYSEQVNNEEYIIRGIGKANEDLRSEEHTSELQSLMRISYAVFCLKKKNKKI